MSLSINLNFILISQCNIKQNLKYSKKIRLHGKFYLNTYPGKPKYLNKQVRKTRPLNVLGLYLTKTKVMK